MSAGHGVVTRQGHKGLERVAALDGIRGVAILLVLMYHISARTADAGVWRTILLPFHVGWIGVDLFFVLSGFLITGILLDSKSERHFFKRFYIRRSLRIFPLYYLALALVFIAGRTSWPPVRELAESTGWHADLALWSYSTNILIATMGWNSVAVPLWPFWSLAVEEQFYILWAPVIWFLSRTSIVRCCVIIMIGAPVLRTLMLAYGASTTAIYVLTVCRMDALAAGALVAAYLRGAPHPRSRVAFVMLGLSAAIALGIIMVPQRRFSQFYFSVQVVGFSLWAMIFASVIGYVMQSRRDDLVVRIVSWRALQVLGLYSYGLYVCHIPVILALHELFTRNAYLRTLAPATAFPLSFGMFVVLTAPIVWVSYRWFEKPMMNLRERWVISSDRRVHRGPVPARMRVAAESPLSTAT